MPSATISFGNVKRVNGSNGASYYLCVTDERGTGSVFFETLDGLKKFAEAANSLIAQEESAVVAGR